MNTTRFLGYVSCAALTTCALAAILAGSKPGMVSDQDKQTQLQTGYRKLPLYFERNDGQADKGVNFVARGKGYTVGLTPIDAVLTLSSNTHNREKDDASEDVRLRMKLVGANRISHV